MIGQVMLAELVPGGERTMPTDGEEKVERTRLNANRNSAYFDELRPDTEYRIGVVAYV